MKFYENASSDSRVFACRQTDMMKLTVAFCSFAKAPKKFQTHFFFRCSQFVTNDATKPESQTAVKNFKRNILGCDDEMQNCR
jgi:hypothetical protein